MRLVKIGAVGMDWCKWYRETQNPTLPVFDDAMAADKDLLHSRFVEDVFTYRSHAVVCLRLKPTGIGVPVPPKRALKPVRLIAERFE